jgi:CHAT domain-containing protein/pimeloyl-ACP methyl ester carboxylesterase
VDVAIKDGSVLRTSRIRPVIKAVLEPAVSRAGGNVPTRSVEVLGDDVMEVELEDGALLWMTAAEFRQRFEVRSARDAAPDDVFRLPAAINVLPGHQARGPVAWALKGAKILGFDAVEGTARQLAHVVDTQKSPTRPGLGLFQCELATDGFALEPASTVSASGTQAALIFLHGTGSSTFGGFGDLWSPRRRDELAAIKKRYGRRVFAFEHATLGKSPIENALELARLIPAGAIVHLVSHSRGGLVGELLCRVRSDDRKPFTPRELQLFDADGRESQRAQLEALGDVLAARKFNVERFVRVACPALGTTLASGRLDRWLNVIGNIVGRAKPGTPLAEAFGDLGDFLLAVVKERTDPKTLPGLEAMMPDSPVVKLVNWPATSVDGRLAVIAGDIEPDARLAKLLVWASDRFYGGDHDLVVNTLSMVGGAKRTQSDQALVAWHKGPHVTHFNYFENDASARQLVAALVDDHLQSADFEPFAAPDSGRIARAARSSVGTEPRPTVFVLPGIMGSELAVGKDKVWLDLPGLLVGGLKKLRLDAAVRPTNLLERVYGELVEHLSATHRVEVFPYDWRLPIEQEAKRLADAVARTLDDPARAGQPVRILAHSMGGLVARTMIARHPQVWQRVIALRGSRLLMLGTPNRGSHAITQLLVGQSSTLKKLAALDVTSSQVDLLRLISSWPGVLSMIPKDARQDFYSPETWQRYHVASGGSWLVPTHAELKRAKALREALDVAAIEPAHMVYVAGSADVTLEGMALETDPKGGSTIRFYGTSRGDGTVTWDSGLLPDVPSFFMDVEHGDLASHGPGFPALLDLLTTGTTTRLPASAPVPRGASERFPIPEPSAGLYPNEETLTAAVLGGGSRQRRTRQRPDAVVTVAVAHGNLGFARHAVAVGHYTGDTIISAERHLDRRLNGALSARLDLGRYPGPLESSAVFINPLLASDPDVTPKGAIVVGLGQVGRLSAATLTRTFTKALLEFVLQSRAALPGAETTGASSGSPTIALSALLIGTGAAGIAVDDSVYALIRGVADANRALHNARRPSQGVEDVPQIGELEIIELYEDRALQAFESVSRLVTDPEFRGRVVAAPTLEVRPGGLTRLQFEEPSGWWQRLQILGGRDDGRNIAPLRFASFTQNARTEVSLHSTQRALVDRFVSQSVTSTIANSTSARTLFQLLLPNELKERAPDQDNLVLLLDESAATYPWELLEDESDGQRRPFAIQHGLLRQLETVEYRRSVQNTTDDAALVIGDPVSRFDALPGAQAEAEEVARRLQGEAFAVSAHICPRGDQVVSALYDRPYRVLHLAGHGVFSPPTADRDTAIVGMIIGDNTLLTPAEVEQMRTVPELVFLNCCHLGHITPSPNKLAANLAGQFIRMGVRAVVAAGWAVDDRAASTFASEFYGRLLRGERFGEAVHLARKATYERHMGTNTWGAYQCYGDPDFRLRRSGKPEADKPFAFCTPSQAVNEARNFQERLKTKGGHDFAWELSRLHDIVSAVTRREWLDRGDVRIALGLAFGEAHEFDAAVEHLSRALELDAGAVAIGTIEQLANFEIRAALKARASAQGVKAVSAGIARGIKRLKQLDGFLSGGGLKLGATTAGHQGPLMMLGSAYKRKALAADGDWLGSLRLMRAYYQSSVDLALEGKKEDVDYPRLNWAAAELALDWQTDNRTPLLARSAAFRAALDASRVSLRSRLAKSPNFWVRIMLVDTDLLTTLGGVAHNADTVEALAKRLASVERAYKNARGTGSPREFASALDQLEFLSAMAQRGGRTAVASALGSLRASLGAGVLEKARKRR